MHLKSTNTGDITLMNAHLHMIMVAVMMKIDYDKDNVAFTIHYVALICMYVFFRRHLEKRGPKIDVMIHAEMCYYRNVFFFVIGK